MAAACIFGEKTLLTARGERYLLYGNVLLKTSLLWPLRELGAQRLLLVETGTAQKGQMPGRTKRPGGCRIFWTQVRSNRYWPSGCRRRRTGKM